MLDPSGPNRTRQRGTARATTIAVATAALVMGAGLPVLATAQAESLAPKRIGSAPVAPKTAVKTTAPADSTQLDLSVTLQPKDRTALTAFVNSVSTPGSPLYKRYLGTGEFGQRFGADPATVQSVRAALTAAGLHPGEVGANGLTIPVKATVAEAKKAFDTDFAGYKLADGSPAYANTKAPQVRGDLAGKIADVDGLNTTAVNKPRSVVNPKVHATAGMGVSAHNIGSNPQMCSSWKSELNSYGLVDGQDYYSSNALAKTYRLDGRPDGGSGSTVAVVSFENYFSNAVAAYQSCNGTKSSVQNIPVGNFRTAAPVVQNSEGFETALDVETIAALAPGASILVYQGENTTQGELDLYQRIVNDNRAQTVSVSWGLCEEYRYQSQEESLYLTLAQAAAQGQTVVAASGDDGSTDCGASAGYITTDSPASQPYVTGVGGVSHTGIGSSVSGMSVWNDSWGAGGGGISYWNLSDSDYAWNAHRAPQYNSFCGDTAGWTCRQVPDVSALADIDNGFLVDYQTLSGGHADLYSVGGTSLAAPIWAALIADANASKECAANGPVGYLNPALHALEGNSSVFIDVTSGTNDMVGSGKYSAASGYDLASGLGVPRGKEMISALCQQLPSQQAGSYTSVQPKRLLDTGTANAVGAQKSTSLKIAGDANSGVPAGVTAVTLNVTVANTTGIGYVTVWPYSKARPVTSNINWVDGSGAVPNLVTVPVDADGKIGLFNGSWSSPARLVVDLLGYYTPDSTGAGFVPLAPARLFDTRYGDANVAKAPIAGQSEISVKVAGGVNAKGASLGVPESGVTAVVLNTTVTKGQGGGWMTVYPTGTTPRPTSSNLNWTNNKTVPNLVVVPVGTDGKVSFYNGQSGQVDTLADVFGYFTTGGGDKFHAAGPKRLVDTRTGKGAPSIAKVNGNTVHIDLNDGGVLSGASSVVLNITVVNTTGDGFLTAWPGYAAKPASSNLNWVGANQMIANAVVVPVSSNAVDFTTNSPADVIVDLMGYYSAS